MNPDLRKLLREAAGHIAKNSADDYQDGLVDRLEAAALAAPSDRDESVIEAVIAYAINDSTTPAEAALALAGALRKGHWRAYIGARRPTPEDMAMVAPGSAWQREAEENGRRMASTAPITHRDSIRREAFEEAASEVSGLADEHGVLTTQEIAERIRALAAPAKEATVDDSRCPDCNRPKARDVHDAATMIGYPSRGVFCPKWWAIRDPEADRDCERHAATKGGADGR